MITVRGLFQFAGSAEYCAAVLVRDGAGLMQVNRTDNDGLLLLAQAAEYRLSDVIAGLPHEVLFNNGAIFTPEDSSWRWPGSSKQQLPARLEGMKSLIVVAVITIPILLWWFTRFGLPAAASALVPLVPVSIEQQIGEQAMASFDHSVLADSALSTEQQQQIRQNFELQLAQLKLSSGYRYQLHFRHSELLGANAFALPGGQLTITDALVLKLQDKPDAILAVLLHEVGHVEHRHGLEMTARATASTIVLSMLFSDLEGVTEAVLGTGTSLLQSAFSRDMEREADSFATRSLVQLGKSPDAFVQAMASFLPKDNKEHSLLWLLKYLQSHPDTRERIESARHQH